MTQDPSSTIKASEAGRHLHRLPEPLRIALWASPLVVIAGYVVQTIFRFPHLSRGAGLTALALVFGLVLGGITALFGFHQLVRRPGAWTKTTGFLLAVNAILLLGAVAIVPKLLT
jgi:uncharacterized membrane protein YdcZ (DUF606 family)